MKVVYVQEGTIELKAETNFEAIFLFNFYGSLIGEGEVDIMGNEKGIYKLKIKSKRGEINATSKTKKR